MKIPGKPPTRADLRNLRGSWLTPKSVELARIRRVDDTLARRLLGMNGRGNYEGLLFPYFWPGQEEICGYRLRRDRPGVENRNGKTKPGPKYLAPRGSSNEEEFAKKNVKLA